MSEGEGREKRGRRREEMFSYDHGEKPISFSFSIPSSFPLRVAARFLTVF
jgi:hypothetical protein